MQPAICSTCDYEFEMAAVGPAGPCCPRCGESVSVYTHHLRHAGVGLEVYLEAMVGGAALGLLAAAILILGPW
jgi:hypothetical protein